MKKILIILFILMATILSGCDQAERVSSNISKEADNFNITRRATVINTRTDTILLEIIGAMSIQRSSGDVDIIVKVSPNQYKKHFVSLNEWTTYVIEDISGAFVDKYHYEVNFLPEMIVPITFTQNR